MVSYVTYKSLLTHLVRLVSLYQGVIGPLKRKNSSTIKVNFLFKKVQTRLGPVVR